VSTLITNFLEGQKQMRQLLGGGIPGMAGMPGMGGMPGMRRSATKPSKGKKAKKKAKGGRPGGDPRRAAASGASGPAGAQAGSGNGELPAALPDEFARQLADGFGELGHGAGLPGLQLPGLANQQGNVPAAFRRQGAAPPRRRKKK
jgi:hypothetical protein